MVRAVWLDEKILSLGDFHPDSSLTDWLELPSDFQPKISFSNLC